MSMLPGISYDEFILSEADEFRRHNEIMYGLQKRLKARQAACPHVHKYFYPDPSGNNGSYHKCLDCGYDNL